MSDEHANGGKICYTFGWGLQYYYDEPEPASNSNHLNLLEIELDDDNYCRNHFYTGLFVLNHTLCGRPRQGCGKTMPVINSINLINFKHLFLCKISKISKRLQY